MNPAASWHSKLGPIPKILGVMVAVLSVYAAVQTLWPRVSVTPGDNLNRYDPFSAPLVISNDGYLSIYAVKLDCTIERLVSSDAKLNWEHVEFEDSLVDHTDDEIGADGRSTHFCGLSITDPNGFKEAYLVAIASFRPGYLPWRVKKRSRFRGYMGDDHMLRWVPFSPSAIR